MPGARRTLERTGGGGGGVKPVWLVAAVVLAAFLVWRRRKLEPTLLAGGAIAVVGMAVYGTGLIELPNLEETLIRVG